ncbi:MAG: hypothetical protein SH856_01280 [Flavobacteriales bacterium]|nr:hypothetical protein [Flavobacteriales bacterium]
MDHIEDIDMFHNHITLSGKDVPISRIYKKHLLNRMNIVWPNFELRGHRNS